MLAMSPVWGLLSSRRPRCRIYAVCTFLVLFSVSVPNMLWWRTNEDARWGGAINEGSEVQQLAKTHRLVNSPQYARECKRSVDIRIDPRGSIHAATTKPCKIMPTADELSSIRVTIFWLIGPGEWTQQVVDEEINEMRQSGLLARTSNIFVWGQDYDRYHSAAGPPPPNIAGWISSKCIQMQQRKCMQSILVLLKINGGPNKEKPSNFQLCKEHGNSAEQRKMFPNKPSCICIQRVLRSSTGMAKNSLGDKS